MIKNRENITNLSKCELVNLSQDVLERGGILRTQVKGTCMEPMIMDRDFVHIKAISSSQIRMGDIVVCRVGEDGMHMHQVYNKNRKINACVGKVIAIERGSDKELIGKAYLKRVYWLLRVTIPKVITAKLNKR